MVQLRCPEPGTGSGERGAIKFYQLAELGPRLAMRPPARHGEPARNARRRASPLPLPTLCACSRLALSCSRDVSCLPANVSLGGPEKAGLANVTATIINLMGFEAPADYV